MMMKTAKRCARASASILLTLALMFTASCSQRTVTITPNEFTRTEAPVPNPMKGFACFYG